MSPTKEYMLDRALQHLDAVLSNKDMSAGEVKHAVGIAADEVRNVIALLQNEELSR
jgi:transcription initiation factor IIE alpha subunit